VVRTVTVKDTLRPVIGLRYQNKLVHVSAGEDVGLVRRTYRTIAHAHACAYALKKKALPLISLLFPYPVRICSMLLLGIKHIAELAKSVHENNCRCIVCSPLWCVFYLAVRGREDMRTRHTPSFMQNSTTSDAAYSAGWLLAHVMHQDQ
jgi:hypothetical protein